LALFDPLPHKKLATIPIGATLWWRHFAVRTAEIQIPSSKFRVPVSKSQVLATSDTTNMVNTGGDRKHHQHDKNRRYQKAKKSYTETGCVTPVPPVQSWRKIDVFVEILDTQT